MSFTIGQSPTVMTVIAEVTASLDGFVAGPNPSLEQPLGEGGEKLHEWLFGLKGFRAQHGLEGGEETADSAVYEESLGAGAVIMGRRMFSGGEGPWEDDPNANGWWGDVPPFHAPVFVLTRHAREDLVLADTTFVFVTDGPEAALDRARRAAGPKPVTVAGGASTIQQYLYAGQIDELRLHIAPHLLGSGTPLFGDRGEPGPELELVRCLSGDAVTHLTYRLKER
jgi:dihydrofolate reductase